MMVPTLLKVGLLLLSVHLTWAMILPGHQQVSCSAAKVADSGDTCASFASKWGLKENRFVSLNPDINCSNLVAGQNYCVVGTVSPMPTTGTPVLIPRYAVPGPDHPGMPGFSTDCTTGYLVDPGDSCTNIENRFGLSRDEFIAWNPSVNKDCTNLIAGFNYCVAVGHRINTSTETTLATVTETTATSSAGNGIPTPTHIQGGMVNNCKTFARVKDGDTCKSIADDHHTTYADIEKWNPGVGLNCEALWSGYDICVGVLA